MQTTEAVGPTTTCSTAAAVAGKLNDIDISTTYRE